MLKFPEEAYDITCCRRFPRTRRLCSLLEMDLWTERRRRPEMWCRSGWQREVAEETIAESRYSWTRSLSFKGKLESAVAFEGYWFLICLRGSRARRDGLTILSHNSRQ